MSNSCVQCGANNRDTAKHCRVCGTLLAPSGGSLLPIPSSSSPQPATASASQFNSARLVTDTGHVHFLLPSATKIGRAAGNDIVLTAHEVSSTHAEISLQGGQYSVTDMGSANGTWVNGQRISGSVLLLSGDRLAFGSEKFTFQVQPAGTVVMNTPPQTSVMPAGGLNLHLPATANRPVQRRLLGPKVVGLVTNANPPQQEQPPTDPARVMAIFALSVGFVGLLLNFALVALTLGIILILCGGVALLFILPFLLIPFQMLYSGLMGWLKDDKPVTALRFSVEDEINQLPIDALLLLKPGTAGNILLGDRVMIWGRLSGASIRATKVTVVSRNGQLTNIPIAAKKPWPIWIGLGMLAIVIGSLVYLAAMLGLI